MAEIDDFYEQLHPEERARFRRQREAEYLKLLTAGRQYLELQELSISNPDPIPKKIFLKKKTHGKADARALTGAEIAEREHRAHDVALAANIACKDDGVTPPGNPLAAGKSPYQATITSPTRPSPRRAPQATHFFSRDGTPEAPELPPSTAPPHLEWLENWHTVRARGARSQKSRLNTPHHAKLVTAR